MTEKSAKPQLRFAGFDDTWEQRKLSQLGSIITGSTPSTQVQAYYSDIGIPWVTPTDISDNVTFRTAKHLTNEGQKVARVVPKNTILVTSIASIGKNTMLGTTGSFNQQINGLVPNEKEYHPYFLFAESALWSDKMKRSAASGTMQIVNKTEFSEINTYVPTLDEQKQIGAFFDNLDNLITLHQRKYDKLTNVKKSMLEKMFPKNGSNVPEIRFKGFSDAWEQRKLCELGEFKSNGVDKLSKPDEYPVNLLNYMDVYNRRNITAINCNELMHVTAKSQQIKDNNVVENDVFFTPTSETADDIGHVMVMEETLENTVYSYHLMRFRPFVGKLYKTFPNYGFATNCVRTQMSLLAQGVQRFVLSKGQFESINVAIPKFEEQKKIADFFTSLDHLITLHQRELEKLKNLKKACLEKMFV